MNPALRSFDSPDTLAEALADAVAAILRDAIAMNGSATLVVSGGNTPKLFLRALSKRPLDWMHVTVTLADDRCVPAMSDRSNARLVRGTLLQGPAAAARFVSIYDPNVEVGSEAADAERRLRQLPRPLDVLVLGMGTDGHTASIFPDAPNLQQLTDPRGRALVMAVSAPSTRERRLTLTLPVLADARYVFLHIEGEAKRSVLDEALAASSAPFAPVRLVLDASRTRPEIWWAPDHGSTS